MQIDKYLKNYIDGALVPANEGNYLLNNNPASGTLICQYPDSSYEDVQKAIEAADRAFPAWAKMDAQRRFRIMMRLSDIIEQNAERFARAETMDTGKPFSMSYTVDIPRAYNYLRYYASSILQSSSHGVHQAREAIHHLHREPIGIVGCIAPWHMPLTQLCAKVGPALAVGNCVVAKPSQETPSTAYLFAKACMEAQLPNGVLNIVFGKDEMLDVSISTHPVVSAISFTGEKNKGIEIIDRTAKELKKVHLEVNSKNANIIFEDCNFDQMMIGTLRSSFSNNGQLTYACPRIYIEEGLYEQFKSELIKRTAFLKVGDPFSSITDLGAIISKEKQDALVQYVEQAESEGAKVLCGGKVIELNGELTNGLFFRPTVLENVSSASHTNQEVTLGPIVSITPFSKVSEAIELANDTADGLAASVWSSDMNKSMDVASQLKVGNCWINGWGVYDTRVRFGATKASGLYQEGGEWALDFFSNQKNICISY
ncbi:MAG: aldehyde dehydrogenase family protein [Bacteroidota bacterium]